METNTKLIGISALTLSLFFSASTNIYAMAVSYSPASPIITPFASVLTSDGVTTGTTQPIFVDVNFDGINDLTLNNTRYTVSSYSEYSIPESYPGAGDDYFSSSSYYDRTFFSDMGSTGSVQGFDLFPGGNLIGTDTSSFGWTNNATLYMDFSSSGETCDGYGGWIDCYYTDDYWLDGAFIYWEGVPDTYVGFSFLIDGLEHFGWADVSASAGILNINSWGWETDANTAIAAGVGSPVPLPPAVWMFGSGLFALMGFSRKMKKPGKIL